MTGGYISSYINTVEVFNLLTQEWRTADPMLKARGGHTIAVLDGVIMVFGGFGASGENTMEIRNETFGWVVKPLQFSHYGHTSVTVPCT